MPSSRRLAGLLCVTLAAISSSAQSPSLPGDANGDGVLDVADLERLELHFSGANPLPAGTLACLDADNDGQVTRSDFDALRTALLEHQPFPATCPTPTPTMTPTVTASPTPTPTLTPTPTPEPGDLVVLSLAAVSYYRQADPRDLNDREQAVEAHPASFWRPTTLDTPRESQTVFNPTSYLRPTTLEAPRETQTVFGPTSYVRFAPFVPSGTNTLQTNAPSFDRP
ncbi:MAG: dockerin type I repeat-containing protein [Sumerlaeia bacterium]